MPPCLGSNNKLACSCWGSSSCGKARETNTWKQTDKNLAFREFSSRFQFQRNSVFRYKTLENCILQSKKMSQFEIVNFNSCSFGSNGTQFFSQLKSAKFMTNFPYIYTFSDFCNLNGNLSKLRKKRENEWR